MHVPEKSSLAFDLDENIDDDSVLDTGSAVMGIQQPKIGGKP